MVGGVTRQGGYPGPPDWVTPPAGVEFCHVNVSRWGNPPSRGRIRDTSNSREIHLGGGSTFSSLLKAMIQSYSTKGCSKAASECRRALIAKTVGLLAFFLFTCLVTIQ